MDREAPTEFPSPLPFARHHAFIIGIDAYERVAALQTAAGDARRLGEVLAGQQHFLVHNPLLDASGADIRVLLWQTMPALVGAQDRVVFYFAGHGIALDGEDGPAGYIIPADADPNDIATMIAMTDLQKALEALPCRHLLLVLDCCFSGAFKWASQTRAIGTLMPKRIYRERFDRYVHDAAWQVITSAAYDQQALDVVHNRPMGARGVVSADDAAPHSPFAQALFHGLAGDADRKGDVAGDGVITATELYCYIRDEVEPETIAEGERMRQTPEFFQLRKHDKGEFIFLKPNHRLNLPPIPPRSPYKGLESFDEADRLLFYGRDRVIRTLREKIGDSRLLVVSGASGTGKSSVVKAGLLPELRAAGWRILPVMRPGEHPLAALEAALAEASPAELSPAGALAGPGAHPCTVLVIDQFEEVVTRCADQDERDRFDARLCGLLDASDGAQWAGVQRIVLTVRADFEPQLNGGALNAHWMAGRCTVPPFSLEELRDIIAMPMLQEVLIFDPPGMVDDIIAEVVQSPGALPLLSYALNELYEAYRRSGRLDRTLRQEDYARFGGVMGALRTRADALLQALAPQERDMMRRIMLRMVSVDGDLASRRVPMDDLAFADGEGPLVDKVLAELVAARLIVRGADSIEPAHDALVRAWKTLHDWMHEAGRNRLLLGARLNEAARAFARSRDPAFLWNDNPNLPVMARALADPRHWFNAAESAFIQRSVARRKRRSRIAWSIAGAIGLALLGLAIWAVQERGQALDEKTRTLRSLFSSLLINLKNGDPGSICVHPSCASAPPSDGGDWITISRLPPDIRWIPADARLPRDTRPFVPRPETSRDFIVARQYQRGHVLVYAHDGLTRDDEIKPDSDNLAFAENALRWVAPLHARDGCPEQTGIVLWPGTFVKAAQMTRARAFITHRGWTFTVIGPATLAADLRCAGVLWYISDWDAKPDFVPTDIPLIERFVREGGGLLVGGLGWSFYQQGPWGRYAANELGKTFGFAFTQDAFEADPNKPIPLLIGR